MGKLTKEEAYQVVKAHMDKVRMTPEECQEMNNRIILKEIGREPLTEKEKEYVWSTGRFYRNVKAAEAADARAMSGGLKRRTIYR